ncbi:nucleoside 2-deoxyribosyltransferase [Pseudarthrobacter sp. W1I19]|uniref:hypothetical protein n=1 Tax=Pseudarthrobacter sp. W1I19 TaxID=3042288 RepID=UPI002781FF9E|nr:hypothetical protein [Pseudarthrobacter sp. W1I19]MDQ0922477.1 nucleoside 2-deoxyribosyltransferase [Pseudarthrobacter sp. W1I19]
MSEPTCFIAMPLTTSEESRVKYHGDADHFIHTLEHLFVPAVKAAGFIPIKPVMTGGDVIQGQIIKYLETADMVLCDISSHNPNVFFELGIRTALDRPVALVRDNHTDKLPFDTAIVNTHTYNSALHPWTIDDDRQGIAQHLKNTKENTPDNNALWGHFGLTKRAAERLPSESPLEAKLDLLMGQVSNLGAIAEFSREPLPVDTDTIVDELIQATYDSGTSVIGATTHARGGIELQVSHGPVTATLAKRISQFSKKYGRSVRVVAADGSVLKDFPRF